MSHPIHDVVELASKTEKSKAQAKLIENVEQNLNAYLTNSNRDYLSEYLMGVTLKDVSILITIEKKASGLEHSFKIIDLDPKPFSCIQKIYRLEMELQEYCVLT